MGNPLDDDRIFEVFARRKREDRFEHIGTITAPGAELARVYAWTTYDEQKWFEMTVAPREAFSAVNRKEAPFMVGPETPVGEGSPADTDSPPGYGVPA